MLRKCLSFFLNDFLKKQNHRHHEKGLVLIQNNRSKKYQPVGGAYKFSEKERDYLSDNYSLEDDDRIPVDEITKLDYRLFVKNKDLKLNLLLIFISVVFINCINFKNKY